MAKISPKITVTANANTATNNPGPSTMALSLTAQPTNGTSDCVTLKTGVMDLAQTHTRFYSGATDGPAFVYVKNLSDVAMYVGGNADMGTANRILNLAAGEFAWMPMSDDRDLYAEAASGSNKKLEYWIFDKA